jgi:hypothetical protein
MDVRRWSTTVVVGAMMLGLLGCGGSGLQVASRGTDSAGSASVAGSAGDLGKALRSATRAANESATRAARRREAFAAFGKPASRTEYVAIVNELHRYYGLLAEARFGPACSLLSRSARTEIAKAAGNSSDARERGCAKRLSKIFAMTIPARHGRPEFRVVSVREVRLKGGGGYVVFTTIAIPSEGQVLSVVQEGGRWRVASPIASPLAYLSASAPSIVSGKDG